MTRGDATETAARLWSMERLRRVVPLADGSADVEVTPILTRGWNESAHHLDPDGRATCHADCADIQGGLFR